MTMLVASGTAKRAGAMAWTRATKDWSEVSWENSQIVTATNAFVFWFSLEFSLVEG
jgi:hypothetical protein